MMLQEISPNAEIVSKSQALTVNIAAGVGLMRVLQSNLGPTGTLKLLVGGAGQLKLTKDGLTLLKEMQIQHPTAALIARTATAQDEVTGDGTTSTVLLVGELLQQAGRAVLEEGVHPRIVADGLDIARDAALKFLTRVSVPQEATDREFLLSLARTSLQTKLDASLVEHMSAAVVDAIQTIHQTTTTATTTSSSSTPIDLTQIEMMHVTRQSAADSRFVRGLVLDHGGRHPDMPTIQHNVHVMICNLSLEYEQTETQAGFVYKTAEEREKLVESERTWLDERCRKIVMFKRSVCKDENNESFCIINQKGVDPLSLDIFAKEGILCLRRAKRRNMERLALATGGQPILSLEDLDPSHLGYAGLVRQVQYGGDDQKYTFVEDCPNARACTLLIQGPNQLTTDQIKDALKDGLRAVKNGIEDKSAVPGAGAFEIAASHHLKTVTMPQTKGTMQMGVAAFAEALLIIPKTLIANAGHDVPQVLLALKQEHAETVGAASSDPDDTSKIMPVGLDVTTGSPILPHQHGIWDNVRVKRQSLFLATVLATQLLLVDEVMRAGKQMGKPAGPGPDDM